jgi:hypothetical protein
VPGFLCTWAPKGRMSAKLTGARRASRGRWLFPARFAWAKEFWMVRGDTMRNIIEWKVSDKMRLPTSIE